MRVGIVGAGNISAIYLKNLGMSADVEVVAVADQIRERAEARATEFSVPRVLAPEDLVADPEVELVVNLTVPQAHAAVAAAALRGGKHVYGEKPLALTVSDGRQLIELAEAQGLAIGNAPDTFLGGGIATARKLIDDGWIGTPVAATAFVLGHGHEHWHPDPRFYYQMGGGPLFDMGPYYLTALVNLMGPIHRVTGAAMKAFSERVVTSKPLAGERIRVETPTHVAGTLEFASGAIATLVASFDVWHSETPWIEVYGTEGTLSVPDPNTFGGPLRVRRGRETEWAAVPLLFHPTDNARGLGVVDLVQGLAEGRPPRASGRLALHVLDAMESILRAAAEGCHVTLTTGVPRPAPREPAELPAEVTRPK